MIKRTASNGSAEGSSRGFLSSIGLGISGRRSMTNNSASTAASGNGNDTTIFQQQEAEGEDGADVPMKSQDFAYYFKSSDQVMKKLETSKYVFVVFLNTSLAVCMFMCRCLHICV